MRQTRAPTQRAQPRAVIPILLPVLIIFVAAVIPIASLVALKLFLLAGQLAAEQFAGILQVSQMWAPLPTPR